MPSINLGMVQMVIGPNGKCPNGYWTKWQLSKWSLDKMAMVPSGH